MLKYESGERGDEETEQKCEVEVGWPKLVSIRAKHSRNLRIRTSVGPVARKCLKEAATVRLGRTLRR